MKRYKIQDEKAGMFFIDADFIDHDMKTGKTLFYKLPDSDCDMDILIASVPSSYAVIEIQHP